MQLEIQLKLWLLYQMRKRKVNDKMIDYNKAYITLENGKEFQVLDKNGETDLFLTSKAIDEYIDSIQIIDDSSEV